MHYYKILKHNVGFDEGTSYWEKILARYLAVTGGGKIHTTLPITFTSTSWKLAGWTVYGNNNVGKNLLSLHTYSTSGIGNVTYEINEQAGTLTVNGSTTSKGGAQISFNFIPSETIKVYFSGCPSGGGISSYDVYCWDTTVAARCKQWDEITASNTDYGNGNCEATLPAGHVCHLTCRIKPDYSTNNIVFKPMLRLPDTSADFEPYQVGVGQRTKNEVNLDGVARVTKGNITITADAMTGYVTVSTRNGEVTSTEAIMQIYLPAGISGDYYLSGSPNGGSETRTYDIYPWNETRSTRPNKWDGTTQARSSIGYTPQQVQFVAGDVYRLGIRIRTGVDANGLIFKPMVRLPDTDAEFIPYGYEVPLDIRHKTKNLLEITATSQTINGVTFTVDKEAGTITANGTASANARLDFHTTEMTVNATDIVNGIPSGATSSTYYILVEFENGTNAFGSNLDNTAIGDRPNFTPRVLGWRIYVIGGQTVNDLVFKPMLRPADTSPEFEPYYLTNHEDIYIGSTPLTEGQTVSDTTGIEVFEGENTIDATLYNKPEMEIVYE